MGVGEPAHRIGCTATVSLTRSATPARPVTTTGGSLSPPPPYSRRKTLQEAVRHKKPIAPRPCGGGSPPLLGLPRWQGGGEGPHRLMPPGSWEVVDRRFNLSSVSSSVTQGIRLQAFSGTVCGKSVETCYYTQKKNATRRSQYSRDCRHHSAHAIPGTPGLGRWPGGPGRSSPFSVGCSLWRP